MKLQKENPGPSGGVITDNQEKVLYAFGSFYGGQSNMLAEARAASEGLQAAWQLNFQQA